MWGITSKKMNGSKYFKSEIGWIDKGVRNNPDSKVHGANMGPIWGRKDPGGPHVGPMNLTIWENETQPRISYWEPTWGLQWRKFHQHISYTTISIGYYKINAAIKFADKFTLDMLTVYVTERMRGISSPHGFCDQQ